MIKNLSTRILIQSLLILVLAAGLIGPTAPAGQPAGEHLPAALRQMAVADPQARVSVIVQKAGATQVAEGQAQALGATITGELSIINAFVAQMQAKDALQLARSQDVRWISLDAPMQTSAAPIDTHKLTSAFVQAVGADKVWNEGPAYLQGQGVAVAVVDSGDCRNGTSDKSCNDLRDANNLTRVVATASYVGGNLSIGAKPMTDFYGHGSLVEGVVGGNGNGSGGDSDLTAGRHMGIAPKVNLVNVKVADSTGKANASDVVGGLQWVLNNKATYNIRVVNLSLNTAVAESYHTSPLAAACEILWFNGIVVVVSAGNNGSASLYAPANDPFVITVGATDDQGTASLADDTMAAFSAYGTDETGAVKPDLVAPGTNLISMVPINDNRIWREHKSNYIKEDASQEYYMRVSGTSFAAPVVSGAVALLLQSNPSLTPDQVKYRLMATANKSWPGYNATSSGAGYLDIYAAVQAATTQSANTGLTASHLLWTGATPITWGSVAWNSVAWNSVAWNSVAWNSVAWNSVSWNSDYWGP